jgi:uncharacterized protein YndB with AHSA1/START domain
MAEEIKHVLEIYIRTTPEKLWQAMTDGDTMEKFFFGQRIDSDWEPGSVIYFTGPDGKKNPSGKLLEFDPPRKMVSTFQPMGEAPDSKPSRLTWEVTPAGESTKLTLVHDQLDAGDPMSQEFRNGWVMFFSTVKTYLETGDALKIDAGK